MNEPQLTAEMKYVHIDWKDMYKDELAQELADEREKVLEEVDALIETHINHLFPQFRFTDSYTGEMFRGRQMETGVVPINNADEKILDELDFIRKQLNQLKGGKC